MSSYSLQIKSLSNSATQFVTVEAKNDQAAHEIARSHARAWGLHSGSQSVEYVLSLGDRQVHVGVTLAPRIPQSKNVLVTIQVDSSSKLHGLLEAIQQYIDNCDEAIEDGKQHSDVSDLAAKVNACSDVKDQLEAVLVGLAG